MAELLQVRSSILIQCVCAVERVDENAFQQQNVMQVITQDNDGQLHTMYIQCKVCGYRHQPVTNKVAGLCQNVNSFLSVSLIHYFVESLACLWIRAKNK